MGLADTAGGVEGSLEEDTTQWTTAILTKELSRTTQTSDPRTIRRYRRLPPWMHAVDVVEAVEASGVGAGSVGEVPLLQVIPDGISVL